MNDQDDLELDARLRDVSIPSGIASRVMPEVLFDDGAIDRLLVRVQPPPGLAERTRRVTAASREGPLPPLLGARSPVESTVESRRQFDVAPVAPWRTRFFSMGRELLADGAAVAAALSIVGLMFFAGTELSRRMAETGTGRDRVASREARPRPSASAADSLVGRGLEPRTTARLGGTLRAEMPSAASTELAGGIPAPIGLSTELTPSEHAAEDGSPAEISTPPSRATAVEVRAAPAAPAFAGGDHTSGRTGIRTVSLPLVGRQVPRSPRYDLAFEMAHGEAPFVDPSADASLAVDRPTLSLRTDSYDALCGFVLRDRGRMAGSRSRRVPMPLLRSEEILAALPVPRSPMAQVPMTQGADVGPAAAGEPELRLSVDAVRSLRPAAGSVFVEVCGMAAPFGGGAPAGAPPPLDVMVLVDQSAGPFGSPSWPWLCRSIGRVIDQMGPADRLSLIVCGERPRLAALRGDAATIAALMPELMAEAAASSADFDAAFRLAADVGRREGRPARIVAAAHAATVDLCRKEGREAFLGWQAKVAAGVTASEPMATSFVLIDPQESQMSDGGSARETPLNMGRVGLDPVMISRSLIGKIFGRATLAATDCRLEVAFDPRTVRSYRIVGYRQTAADGLTGGDRRGVDLHAGEAVRVVYELIRRQSGTAAPRADLVSATLTWTSAATGLDVRSRHRLVRQVLTADSAAKADLGAVTPSPHGCEVLLAVALGELATSSVHGEPWRHSTAGVAALASRWKARGDVTPIGEQLIDCLRYQGLVQDTPAR